MSYDGAMRLALVMRDRDKWKERAEKAEAEREQLRRNYHDVADAIARTSTGSDDLCAKVRAMRAELAALRRGGDAERQRAIAICLDEINKCYQMTPQEFQVATDHCPATIQRILKLIKGEP